MQPLIIICSINLKNTIQSDMLVCSYRHSTGIQHSNYIMWTLRLILSMMPCTNQFLTLFLNKKAHIKFKASSSGHDYREFSLLRARFKYESKKCLRNYVTRIESSLISNPAGYWKFVKNKKSFSMIPKVVSYSESTSANEQEAANLFSLFFSSVFSVNDFDLDTTSFGIKSFDLPTMLISS
ncbi:hypothetical protein ACI65C_000475 [Semiaphis heraclei]